MSEFDDPADGGPGDAVGGGDLAEALSEIPFPEHRDPADVHRPTTDVTAFEPGPADAGPDSCDAEVPFELGDRADERVTKVSPCFDAALERSKDQLQ